MYNKLFSRILDSSIWLEPNATRICWITLLAAMDETGYAHFAAIENLASRARVTTEEAQAAVDAFTNPDTRSPHQPFDGRRVERVPGGFIILNAGHYRSLANKLQQKEETRIRVAEWRKKKAGNGHVTKLVVPNRTRPPEADTEAEANTEAYVNTNNKSDSNSSERITSVLRILREFRVTGSHVRKFVTKYEEFNPLTISEIIDEVNTFDDVRDKGALIWTRMRAYVGAGDLD